MSSSRVGCPGAGVPRAGTTEEATTKVGPAALSQPDRYARGSTIVRETGPPECPSQGRTHRRNTGDQL